MHRRIWKNKKKKKNVEDITLIWNIRHLELSFFKSWFFGMDERKDTRHEPGQSEGKSHRASANLLHPNASIPQTAVLELDAAKCKYPSQFWSTSGIWTDSKDETQVNFGYRALIKRLTKPRWEHSAQWEGGAECWLVLQAVHQLYPLSAGPVVPESSPGLLGRLISSQGINQFFMGLVECTAAQTDY